MDRASVQALSTYALSVDESKFITHGPEGTVVVSVALDGVGNAGEVETAATGGATAGLSGLATGGCS